MSEAVGESKVGNETRLGKRKGIAEVDEEERTKRFMKALVGSVDAPGILLNECRSGKVLVPYPHQRRAVKFMLPSEQKRSLLVHDPGLGKTITVLLLAAAMYVVHRGSKSDLKFLFSVPASCIEQWKRSVVDVLRLAPRTILSTNKLGDLTKENIAMHTVIIVSRDTVGRAFSSCYEYVTAHHLNKHNKWVSAWDRIPNTPLHALFNVQFSLVGIDELHFCRNKSTACTNSHELLVSKSKKAVGMTATPVFNSPRDLMGISTAMDLEPGLKTQANWFTDKEMQRVNTDTIEKLNNKYTHRADDSILDLPPITHEYINFDANVDPDVVPDYNEVLSHTRSIRFSIERNGGRAQRSEMNKLMAGLQTMQQFLVSPKLADKGALELKTNPEIVEEAAKEGTGALKALRDNVVDLKSKGFRRIMVAACHVSLLKIAQAYLREHCPEAGHLILYEGSLTQPKRTTAVDEFLGGSDTTMLMSIEAGGTGLNLTPGANAVIFWGSRPFSPMQILQTSKRVHRIGQEHPVLVRHLIAKGSVDNAINAIHGDKLTLSNAVIDMELDGLKAEGGKWRTTGRIVDSCKFLDENGVFPETDVTEEAAQEAINQRKALRNKSNQSNQSDNVYLYGFVDRTLDPSHEMPPLPSQVVRPLMQNAVVLENGALNTIRL